MYTIGMISGTSVDGIDVVIADIHGKPWLDPQDQFSIKQIAFETISWPDSLREQIFALFHETVAVSTLCRLNFILGQQFAQAALQVIEQAGLVPQDIQLIGSHGQTIWHDVEAGQAISTLQIGEPSVIAAQTGITTVANFRTADIAVGGQGAPLTSTFDWLILRPPPNLNGIAEGWRAVQNIGGIANVTFLPPTDVDASPIALDSGPGNVLIDWAAFQATDGHLHCDIDGKLAALGVVDETLLAEWLKHPYFQQSLPKTTGRERFGVDLAQRWYNQGLVKGLTAVDVVATLTELTAHTIAQAYIRYAPGTIAQVVVGGGGTHNPMLMARLEANLAMNLEAHYNQHLNHSLNRPIELCTHSALGIDDDAKEALAFALLAYLTFYDQPGNLPTCTGARKPQILGQIAKA